MFTESKMTISLEETAAVCVVMAACGPGDASWSYQRGSGTDSDTSAKKKKYINQLLLRGSKNSNCVGFQSSKETIHQESNYPTCTCEGVHEILLMQLHHMFLVSTSVTGEYRS